MTKKALFCLAFILSLVILFFGMKVGSTTISVKTFFQIILHPLGDLKKNSIDLMTHTILLNVRIPRVVMAFLVGAALAISGTVMQSLLGNPLASAYTLGVSSGASLGAAMVMVSGFTLPGFSLYLLPFVGFIFGLGTVLIVLMISRHLDQNLMNQTVILVGMVVTLFVGAILTMVTAFAKSYLEQLVFWQMGSFSGSSWEKIVIFIPILLLGMLGLWRKSQGLDVLTLGEEQAMVSGVEVKSLKLWVMILAALLTGTAVAFAGVIGFVDLIAPHVVRRYFGAGHKWVIPSAALLGGSLMVAADTLSRSVLSPQEIPVGAVTALIGAPFFMYVYFNKRRASI